MMTKTKQSGREKAVRKYKVGKGFNIAIGEKDRDRDFGPGQVMEIDGGLEVRYDIGMGVSATQLPKMGKNVFRWLMSRGCLVKAGVQEGKTDG